jgi:hypothetical protein
VKTTTELDMAALLKRLEIAYDQVPMRRVKIKDKLVEKTFNPLFEQICIAFDKASADERVDAYLAFETRDNLLDALTIYGGETASNVPLLARTGKRDKANALLKRAIVAQVIVDKRANDDLEDRAHMILLDAVQETDFPLARYQDQVSITAKDFSKRARDLHKQRRHVQAAKALGIALQKDPNREPDPRLADLARILTNKPANAAVAMLREPFQREKYILENTRHHPTKSSAMEFMGRDLQFWGITGGGAVGLLIAGLFVGYVLASATIPSSMIFMVMGFAVGTGLGGGFVWYRLKHSD